MSAGHGPPPTARGQGAAPVATPGLLTKHRLLRATRGRGPAATAAPGLLTRHGPLCAARGRGPVAAAAPSLSTGQGLCVLLAVAVPLLLQGCGGHAVQIVLLVVNDK
jgi:hypothetical protein